MSHTFSLELTTQLLLIHHWSFSLLFCFFKQNKTKLIKLFIAVLFIQYQNLICLISKIQGMIWFTGNFLMNFPSKAVMFGNIYLFTLWYAKVVLQNYEIINRIMILSMESHIGRYVLCLLHLRFLKTRFLQDFKKPSFSDSIC